MNKKFKEFKNYMGSIINQQDLSLCMMNDCHLEHSERSLIENLRIKCLRMTGKNLSPLTFHFSQKPAPILTFPHRGRKCAFTLAEVLITLGIIGVIAAITMPTLIQNYKKTVYVNQLKKVYSVMEQGFQRMKADDDVELLSDTSVWADISNEEVQSPCAIESTQNSCKNFRDKFQKYFNSTIGEIAWGWKFLNAETIDDCKGDAALYLNDGAVIIYYIYSQYDNNPLANDPVARFDIDINGKKGPNTYGRDIFNFELLNNGKLYSTGDYDSCLNGSSTGASCFTRIVENGWKMDY